LPDDGHLDAFYKHGGIKVKVRDRPRMGGGEGMADLDAERPVLIEWTPGLQAHRESEVPGVRRP